MPHEVINLENLSASNNHTSINAKEKEYVETTIKKLPKRLHTKNKRIMREETKKRATYHLPEFLCTNGSITNTDCSNINNVDSITEKKGLSHKKYSNK